MKYFSNLGILIIFGGKNDKNGVIFDDIHTLKLYNFTWCKLDYNKLNSKNEIQIHPRSCFDMDIHESKVYIFGGINFQGLMCTDILTIELGISSLLIN